MWIATVEFRLLLFLVGYFIGCFKGGCIQTLTKLSQALWTTTPKNIYHPYQFSIRCIVKSLNSWSTVPLGVVVKRLWLNLSIMIFTKPLSLLSDNYFISLEDSIRYLLLISPLTLDFETVFRLFSKGPHSQTSSYHEIASEEQDRSSNSHN